jgi:hypothetical protein
MRPPDHPDARVCPIEFDDGSLPRGTYLTDIPDGLRPGSRVSVWLETEQRWHDVVIQERGGRWAHVIYVRSA